MTSRQMNYAQLHEFLHGLGFRRQIVHQHQLAYEHVPSDTLIILSQGEPESDVREADLVSIQKHLVDKGLIDENEMSPVSREPGSA